MNTAQLSRLLGRTPHGDPNGPEAKEAWQKQRTAQHRLETYYEGFPERTRRIGEHMQALMKKAGISSGIVL